MIKKYARKSDKVKHFVSVGLAWPNVKRDSKLLSQSTTAKPTKGAPVALFLF